MLQGSVLGRRRGCGRAQTLVAVWISLSLPLLGGLAAANAQDMQAKAVEDHGVLSRLTVAVPPLPPWVPQVLGGQITVIEQAVLPFHSPFAGPNSLTGKGDEQLTHTYGVYFGSQVFDYFQVYLDVEMFKGAGISNAVGIGGLTNGDVIRQGAADIPKDPYVARVFGRWIIPLSEDTAGVSRAMDHLPSRDPSRRLEFKIGKFALNEEFDQNRYANSARTQFLNWSLWANTAWDYAADTRGFTNGIMGAWVTPQWTFRIASVQEPTLANGNTFDNDLKNAHGDNAELTLGPFDRGTVVRFLAYANHARMGVYQDAIRLARATAQTPSVAADDRAGRVKYGYGFNLEQPVADDGETGVFLRFGWNDGKTESFAFTEVDQTLSLGLQLNGVHWSRPRDQVGVGYVLDWISSDHRQYLKDGGSGFVLGDGRLNYGTERILEAYYRWQVFPYVQLSPDYQFIQNPGYNRSRGPAHVFAVRLHLSF